MGRRRDDYPIDIVIPWVDGSDSAWRAEKAKWQQKEADQPQNAEVSDTADARYRDWELLRYWFRGIEKFMPWVRTIHFVTCGHLPDWLNIEHPKLNHVKHKDYIPPEYLPTFNSNVIEMNFHRIEGLSERYILFNDDMYAIKPTRREDFFKCGFPRGTAVLNPSGLLWGEFFLAEVVNCSLLNKYFNMHRAFLGHPFKWINPKYGLAYNLRTICMLPWPKVKGFFEFHTANAYLKKNFENLWELEPEYLDKTCRHKFRELTDLSDWIIEGWQFLDGEFIPRSPKFSEMFRLKDVDFSETLPSVIECIKKQKHKLICVNDYSTLSWNNFEKAKMEVKAAFETILPDKCSFEKD